MYRIHDQALHSGCFYVEYEDAPYWNGRGWGIFECPNPVKGTRCAANVTEIEWWFVDMDSGTRDEQESLIRSSPLRPSWIVMTARGFHLYWAAKNASKETWKSIVSDRLIPFFGADSRASDMSRLLRVPGYWHLKGKPFLIQTCEKTNTLYTEDEMLFMFPEVVRALPPKRASQSSDGGGDDFWRRVVELDCGEALLRLSGHRAVKGEVYELRSAGGKGGQNIYVNSRPTSCWVDANGKLGSYSGGGPNLYSWLSWFGHSPSEVARIIKEVFPEVAE